MFSFVISVNDFRPVRNSGFREETSRNSKQVQGKPSNDLLELADINFGNPLVQPPPAPTRTAASALAGDPWGMAEPAGNDPWGGQGPEQAHDPWSPVKQVSAEQPRASPLAHRGLASPGHNGDGIYPALSKNIFFVQLKFYFEKNLIQISWSFYKIIIFLNLSQFYFKWCVQIVGTCQGAMTLASPTLTSLPLASF